MENTVENKAKFFALYFGQRLVRNSNWIGESADVTGMGLVQILEDSSDKTVFLELRSVDMLTDGERAKYLSLSPTTQDALEALEGRLLVADEMQKWEHLITWLRSIGIAIPFMGLSVEKLIEYGWVKIVKP